MLFWPQAINSSQKHKTSHFASKQDILDTLVDILTREFDAHSIFARADWDAPAFTQDKKGMTPEAVGAMVKGQIRYNLHDPKISKVRKLLTIQQFQNEIRKRIEYRCGYVVFRCSRRIFQYTDFSKNENCPLF